MNKLQAWFFPRTKKYYLLHPWVPAEEVFANLWRALQRFLYGWDSTLGWDTDWYLAKLIPVLLEQLKNDGRSIPGTFYNSKMSEEEMEQQWHIVLDKIIDGFRAAEKITELDYTEGELEELEIKFHEGMAFFERYFFDLWS